MFKDIEDEWKQMSAYNLLSDTDNLIKDIFDLIKDSSLPPALIVGALETVKYILFKSIGEEIRDEVMGEFDEGKELERK